jgi:hypothetical protein
MDDRFDALQRHGIAGDVGLDEAEARKLQQAGEVPLFHFARVERIEVVHARHFVPSLDERFTQVRSDKAR